MIFPYEYKNDVLVVKIDEKDSSFSEIIDGDFCKETLELNVHSSGKIAFELTGKKYFNSADLGTLIKIKDILLDEGIELVLINPSDKTTELFDMVGVSDFFVIMKDDEGL